MRKKYVRWRDAVYKQMPEGEWTAGAILDMDIKNCRGRPYGINMMPKNVQSATCALQTDGRFEKRRRDKNSAYVWKRKPPEEGE